MYRHDQVSVVILPVHRRRGGPIGLPIHTHSNGDSFQGIFGAGMRGIWTKFIHKVLLVVVVPLLVGGCDLPFKAVSKINQTLMEATGDWPPLNNIKKINLETKKLYNKCSSQIYDFERVGGNISLVVAIEEIRRIHERTITYSGSQLF
ncbi:MAG: hypothetical protein QGF38_02840 [Rhodospirillales bacterium]|nr:hypothetical protein [Rhodospirillales bacterium]